MFDELSYMVQEGKPLIVQVLYDADSTTAGNQPIAGGLYSEGLSVSFAAASAQVASIAGIVLPSALNGDGTGGPAFLKTSAGLAGGAGALSLSANSGYAETLLATITIQDLAPAGSQYTLELGKYFANQANFVDFNNGATRDAELTFGKATVTVVPEPTCLGLAGLVILGLVRRVRTAKTSSC